MNSQLKQFCLPDITQRYIVRLLLVGILAYIVFEFLLLPFRIHGHSMDPTYKNGNFNFCFRQRFVFSTPERYDVVCVKLAGEKIVLLKRVIALEGEVVEIRNGEFFVNEKKIDEDYVHHPSDWNLPPRVVKKNNVYVVGDNRNVPIDVHRFGQTPVKRIIGTTLW